MLYFRNLQVMQHQCRIFYLLRLKVKYHLRLNIMLQMDTTFSLEHNKTGFSMHGKTSYSYRTAVVSLFHLCFFGYFSVFDSLIKNIGTLRNAGFFVLIFQKCKLFFKSCHLYCLILLITINNNNEAPKNVGLLKILGAFANS